MPHISIWSGDATANTYVQDFSPLVMSPPAPGGDIALYPIVGKLADGTNIEKYEWVEYELTKKTVSGTTTAGTNWNNTTDTTWTLDTGEVAAAGLRTGAILKDVTDRTKRELIYVSSIAGDNITVVRDYSGFVSGAPGGTTGEVHATTCTFEIVGYLNFQNAIVSKTDNIVKRNRSTKYNYYSILDDRLRVSAEDLVREYRGSSPDNWGYQLDGLRQRWERMLETVLISSGQVPMDATHEGSMGGLVWYATQTPGAAGNCYVSTPATASYNEFDAGMAYLFTRGTLDENPDIVCLMPGDGIRAAARFDASLMRGEYANEQVRGLQCTKLMSSLKGMQVPLVPCLNIPSDSFMLINLNAVRIHFMRGLALAVFYQEVGQNLEATRAARLYSAMTLEVQRPLDNIYFRTGLTWSL